MCRDNRSRDFNSVDNTMKRSQEGFCVGILQYFYDENAIETVLGRS